MNLTISFIPYDNHYFYGKCFRCNPSTFTRLYIKEIKDYLNSKSNAYKIIIHADTIRINKLNYFATFQ